jgi:predicted TPR repeat methyltransferase
MIDRYSDYADFYDQGTTTDVTFKVNLVRQKINQYNPYAKSLLELACGTGNILAQLVDEYALTGIDLSPNMLKIAKEKLPSAELYATDMTDFNLGKKFDVIICLFDSVNHLLSFEEWKALFDRAKEHLSDKGVFIIDMNTIAKLEKFSSFPASRQEMGDDYQITKIIKTDDNVYHWNLDIHKQQEDGNYEVISSDIPEVAFPLIKVKAALASCFGIVDAFTPDGAEANELAYRVYYACKINA